MFRPEEFDVADPALAAAHLRAFPFGVLTTNGPDGPEATHLPFLLGPMTQDEAFPATVVSHGSARNPHLRGLVDGARALVVLPGPDAYVSADWYEAEPDVPTWNYTAVHVRGTIERLDRGRTDALLDHTVRSFESDRGTPGWDLDRIDPALVAQLAAGVIAFAVHVDEVTAVAKLSQDKTAEDVGIVRDRLSSGDAVATRVAEQMRHHDVQGRPADSVPSTSGPPPSADRADEAGA